MITKAIAPKSLKLSSNITINGIVISFDVTYGTHTCIVPAANVTPVAEHFSKMPHSALEPPH